MLNDKELEDNSKNWPEMSEYDCVWNGWEYMQLHNGADHVGNMTKLGIITVKWL